MSDPRTELTPSQPAPPMPNPDRHNDLEFWHPPGDFSFKHEAYVVLVETGFETDDFTVTDKMEPARVTWRMDGADTTAEIFTQLDSEQLTDDTGGSVPAPQGIGGRHYAHLLEEFTPDKRVRIVGQDRQVVLFDGYPLIPTLRWNQRQQVLSLTCKSRPETLSEDYEGAQIAGRYLLINPTQLLDPQLNELRLVTAAPLHFNAGGTPNRAATPIISTYITSEGFELTITWYPFTYDGDPAGQPWTVAQALAYLIVNYHTAAMGYSVDDFWHDIVTVVTINDYPDGEGQWQQRMTGPLDDLRLDAVNLRTALTAVCARGGLHLDFPLELYIGTQGDEWRHKLRIWAIHQAGTDGGGYNMGGVGQYLWPRDTPHKETWNRSATAVAAANPAPIAQFSFDRRSVKRTIRYSGVEFYELTLPLVPGWLPFTPENAEHYPGVTIPPNPPSGSTVTNVVDDATLTQAVKEYWGHQLNIPGKEVKDALGNILSPWHPAHPKHHLLADVLRLWIFPCDQRRAGVGEAESRWARPGYAASNYEAISGGGNALAVYLAEAVDWVARQRILLQPISGQGAGRGGFSAPVVEAKYKNAPTWQVLEGDSKFAVLGDECGIRLKHPNLLGLTAPGRGDEYDKDNFIYSYLTGDLQLRATATIEGDSRMKSQVDRSTGYARLACQIGDTGGRFRYRNRDAGNSALKGDGATDARYTTRDDQERADKHTEREARLAGHTAASGNPAIFWIEPGLRLGDRIEGISGLGITFPQPTEIVTISFGFGNNPSTQVNLADLREDADIESVEV